MKKTLELLLLTLSLVMLFHNGLFTLPVRAQHSAHSDEPLTSNNSMSGVTVQQTRVFNNEQVKEPKGLKWKSEKLFSMREYRSASIQIGTGTFSGQEATGHIFSVPIIANNTIWFSGYFGNGYLYALDALTGKTIKVLRLNGMAIFNPVIAGDLLMLGSNAGVIMAFDLNTAKQKWSSGKEGYVFNVSCVADDLLFFSGLKTPKDFSSRGEGVAGAMDPFSGQLKWTLKTKGFPTRIAVADHKAVFGDEDENLFALDSKTGQELWKVNVESKVIVPAIMDGRVFFPGEDGNVRAVSLKNGQLEWKAKLPDKVRRSPGLHQNTVFVCGLYNSIYALDAATGQVKWIFKTSKPCLAPFIIQSASETTLLFLCEDKHLYSLDVNSGQLRWKYKNDNLISKTYTIANGTIFTINKEGFIQAVQ